MIDRQSRDRLALALRRYVACRITNDDLHAIDVDWRDRGAVAVKGMSWQLYSDNYQHRADREHRLSGNDRRIVARWIIFLHADKEYLWPEFSFYSAKNLFMIILTLGAWRRHQRRLFEEFCAAGDFECWPFISAADFQSALSRPRYLSRKPAS